MESRDIMTLVVLVVFSFSNDVPHELQRNVSIAAIRGADDTGEVNSPYIVPSLSLLSLITTV